MVLIFGEKAITLEHNDFFTMIHKYLLTLAGVAPLATWAGTGKVQTVTTNESRPNIIMFLVDDMGWQDTSVPFYNNQQSKLNQRYRTPNMERLAQLGVRLRGAV